MRIAFDAKRAFLNKTGLGNYSRNVLESIRESNSDDVLFPCTPKVSEEFSNMAVTSENFEVLLPTKAMDKSFPGIWRSKTILSQLKDLKVELYHGLSNELPFGISKTGIHSVVTIHDLIFLRYPSYYTMVDSLIYRLKVKRACREADRIIAVSEHTKKDIVELLRISPEKIDVVYQTCHERFGLQVSEEQKIKVQKKNCLPSSYVLSVGTIEKRKNLTSIIDAIARVPNVHLVVVGKSTDYIQEVKGRIIKLGLEKRVMFIHEVEIADLPAIYQLAEMLVYPSQYEGFGIPVLEALYSGIPVITTRGGCFEEAGGPDSLYVAFGDIPGMSEAILNVLGDPDLRSRMTNKGKEYAEKFNNHSVAIGLKKTYEKAFIS